MSRSSLSNLHKLISSSAESVVSSYTPSLEILFLNSLEEAITIGDTKPNKSSLHYKPSSMNCLRNMYYGVKGALRGEILEERKANLVGILESGTDRHTRIQGHISKMNEKGFKWEYLDVAKYIEENNFTNLEVRKPEYADEDSFETLLFDKDLNMILSMDGLLRYNDNEVVGFEYKTETYTTWNDRNGVDDKHKNQAYAYATQLKLDKIIFVYENRNNCYKKAYMLKITEKDKQTVINRINECDEYVKTNTLPPKSNNKNDCYFCKYKEICDRGLNAEENKDVKSDISK